MRYFNLLFVLVLIGTSCTNSEIENDFVINPAEFTPKNIVLSDFATDVSYVQLSNELLMQSIRDVEYCEGKFIISEYSGCLTVYDKNGMFLNTIGEIGHGPGEYKSVIAFAVNLQSKSIFVLGWNKVLVYSESGEYKNTIDCDDFGENFQDIGCINNQIILFEQISFGSAKYNWLIIDEQGNQIGAKLNSMPSFKSRSTLASKLIYKFDGNYCYWNTYNDTIFEVSPETYQSRYLFASNNYRLTPENVDDPKIYSSKIFRPKNILESQKYLFMNYYMQRKTGFALLNKSERKVYSLEQDGDDDIYTGYINDIDGGVYFKPVNYLKIDGHDYLVSYVDAVSLKVLMKSQKFKSATPKYPEKKRELEKLANSLNNNDNPVLMLVKLKE